MEVGKVDRPFERGVPTNRERDNLSYCPLHVFLLARK
jgi:hypothetical protein